MSWIIYRLYTNTIDQLDGAEDLRHPSGIARYFYSFLRETSLQGIPQIIKQPGIVKKLLWLAVVIACFVGLIWEMDMFVDNIFKFKTLTSVSSKLSPQLPFPAVTICNNNAVTSNWLKQAVQNLNRKNGNGTSVPMTVNEMEAQSILPVSGDRLEVGHYICDLVMSCSFNSKPCNPIDEEFDTNHFNPAYGNCFTFNAGYKKQTSPMRLVTNDAWPLKMGTPKDSKIRISRLQGPQNGLRLVLSSDVERYLPSTEQVGWRIVIHNQTEMPFPSEDGIAIMPGTSTEIALTQKYSKKLGFVDNTFYKVPYSDCSESTALNLNDTNNAFAQILEVAYSFKACQKTCYQRNLMQQCNCYDWSYPHRGPAFAQVENVERLPVCLSSSAQCMERVLDGILTGKFQCKCPDTCSSYTFDMTVSSSKWPNSNKITLARVCSGLLATQQLRAANSDVTCTSGSRLSDDLNTAMMESSLPQQPQLKQLTELEKCASLKVDDEYNKTSANTDEFTTQTVVGRKYAQVLIYYKDFNVQSFVEEQQFELMDFIAYLGAIMSLFLGITVITACEYAQLVLDLVLILLWNLFIGLKALFEKCLYRIRSKDNSRDRAVVGPPISRSYSNNAYNRSSAITSGSSSSATTSSVAVNNFPDIQMLDNLGSYGGADQAVIQANSQHFYKNASAPEFKLEDEAWR